VTGVPDIVSAARLWLRDFAGFYTDSTPGNGLQYAFRLSAPLVRIDSTFQAMDVDSNGNPTQLHLNVDYTVDARNGFIILNAPTAVGHTLIVNFFAYEWFLDDDLTMFANFMIGEHTQNRPDFNLATIEPAEVEVIGLGTTIMALWSLSNELARDIDVTTYVDGTNIPASQRFHQVLAMVNQFKAMYSDKAAMLNVGLDRIEMFALRRVSLTTNRLVPVYRPREVDDLGTPIRVYPHIDPEGNAETATPEYHQAPSISGFDPFLY
jgi:hypothetical protein